MILLGTTLLGIVSNRVVLCVLALVSNIGPDTTL
jgi:hypothetical protein